MLALWAELQVVVGDEFRDGNVPAQQGLLGVAQRGFQALPKTVTERYFRGDSACDEDSLLSWLRDEKRADGPQGFIGFAVSARMNPGLRAAVVAMPEAQWQPYSEDSAVVKECAEVDYVPDESAAHRYREPLRYVAIRIRKKQGELFADGSTVKYFAVVTNLWEWTPKKLLQWHREKAGSIEAVHDVIKNELAGGVMPGGRFGANAAAWLRLAVLTYNVLTALKRLALPAELISATQAFAVSDLLHAGETGASRTAHAVAAGSDLAAVFQLATCLALVAFTRALLRWPRSPPQKSAIRPQEKGRSVSASRLPDRRGMTPRISCLPQRVISSSPHRSQCPLAPYGRITVTAADNRLLVALAVQP